MVSGLTAQTAHSEHLYWKLFSSTFYISAFTVGGGFVIIPLMKKKFADEYHWIEEQEMLDLAAIAQSAPGALAVNAAILVGYRVAGVRGILVSTLATILPPLITISLISLFYEAFRTNPVVAAVLKGMAAGVAAVVADVVCDLGGEVLKERSWLSALIIAAAFCVTFFTSTNVVWVVVACGIIGALRVLYRMRHPASPPGTESEQPGQDPQEDEA